MQDLYPRQLCARNTDHGAVGRDTRDQVSHGKLEVKEYLDVECSMRVEQRMLWNPGQGDRVVRVIDYMCHNLGGLVVSLHVIPVRRGVCYVIKEIFIK